MDWIRRNDKGLMLRFIVVKLGDDTQLLKDILRFCSTCLLLMKLLEQTAARTFREEVASTRQKWLLRLAFYPGALPTVSVSSLPLELTAELDDLDSSKRSDPRPIRLDLSDQSVRHIAYRVLQASRDASGPVEDILRELSSASRAFLLPQSVLEVRLAGYTNIVGERSSRTWAWRIGINVANYSDVNVFITENNLPKDIHDTFLNLFYESELSHDSTGLLNAA